MHPALLAFLALYAAHGAAALSVRSPSHQVAPAVPTESTAFCWTIASPWDKTLALARQQMAGCSDYAIFSNYSKPEEKTIQLFTGDMGVNYVATGPEQGDLWANLTHKFRDAWQYIRESSWPDKYQWLVKLDADTYLRPRNLLQRLAHFDASAPIGIAPHGGPHGLRFEGAMEVVSSKILRHERTPLLFKDLHKWTVEDACEDVWLGHAMKQAGFKLVRADTADGCVSFLLWWGHTPAKYRVPVNSNRGENILLGVLKEAGPTLPTGFGNRSACVHPDLVALHPVKSPAVFAQFQSFDRESQDGDPAARTPWVQNVTLLETMIAR